MRRFGEVLVILTVAAFTLTGVAAFRALQEDPDRGGAEPVAPAPPAAPAAAATPEAAAWFRSFRVYCNPVDVDTRMRWQPAPGSVEGDMYEAACYALAGRVDAARAVIEGMPADRRYEAAGVVFEVGHPAADAGDERAAGPLMELVVEFWPNHYMALYHAGAAAFDRGDYGPAWSYLERFLQEYGADDGWRANAERMLDVMTRIER